jgi:hypothetical protein
VVKLPGVQAAIPEWMLNSRVCDQLKTEDKPELASVLSWTCVDSSMRSLSRTLPRIVVVQNLQEEVRMHSNETPTGWQRRLHFEDEEIMAGLTASA